MAGPSPLKDWRSLRLSFPIWTGEGSACPPLISLWNPSWGPLFSADHHPPRPHTASAPPTTPLLLLPHPQPLTLASLSPHRPSDGLLRPSPLAKVCSLFCWGWSAGVCTLDLGLANKSLGWGVSVPQFPPQQLNFYVGKLRGLPLWLRQ